MPFCDFLKIVQEGVRRSCLRRRRVDQRSFEHANGMFVAFGQETREVLDHTINGLPVRPIDGHN